MTSSSLTSQSGSQPARTLAEKCAKAAQTAQLGFTPRKYTPKPMPVINGGQSPNHQLSNHSTPSSSTSSLSTTNGQNWSQALNNLYSNSSPVSSTVNIIHNSKNSSNSSIQLSGIQFNTQHNKVWISQPTLRATTPSQTNSQIRSMMNLTQNIQVFVVWDKKLLITSIHFKSFFIRKKTYGLIVY